MSALTAPPAQPAAAAPSPTASVIRRLDGSGETAQDRLVKKHLPAWVVSGVAHASIIALAIAFFPDNRTSESSDKIVSSAIENEPPPPKEEAPQDDIGLESSAAANVPEIERIEKQTVEYLETKDPIGLPNATNNDNNAYTPPGLSAADLSSPGAVGTEGSLMTGSSSGAGMVDASFSGRSGATKNRLLERGGGSPASERSVDRGLAWLVRQQKPGGYWEFDGEEKKDRAAATGLALLPFLAAGHTHKSGKYQKVVDAGLRWLVNDLRPNGRFASGKTMYSQGIATLPLCEAYGMTKDKTFLLGPAQQAINFIQKAQGSDGSWGYAPETVGDTSIVGWQIQALKAAQLSRDIVVDDKVVRAAMSFLDRVGGGTRKSTYGYQTGPGEPGTSLTAVGLLCRYYSSGWGPNNAGMAEGVDGLAKNGPKFGKPIGEMYYYYYATQVVHFYEGEEWKKWNEGPLVEGKRTGGMRDWLVNLQVSKEGPNLGSWDADAGFMGKNTGRLGTTCMCLLTLEVYYRHLPLYKRDAGAMKAIDGVK